MHNSNRPKDVKILDFTDPRNNDMRHSDKSACTWLIDDSGYLWHTVAVTREVALVGLPTVSATRSYCPLSPRITALASETNVVFSEIGKYTHCNYVSVNTSRTCPHVAPKTMP